MNCIRYEWFTFQNWSIWGKCVEYASHSQFKPTKFIYSTNLRETEAERRGRRRRTTKRGNADARSSKGERAAQAMLDRRPCNRRGGGFGGEKSGHEVRSSERGLVALSLACWKGKGFSRFWARRCWHLACVYLTKLLAMCVRCSASQIAPKLLDLGRISSLSVSFSLEIQRKQFVGFIFFKFFRFSSSLRHSAQYILKKLL